MLDHGLRAPCERDAANTRASSADAIRQTTFLDKPLRQDWQAWDVEKSNTSTDENALREMQLPDPGCERSSNETTALQERTNEHDLVSAKSANKHGDKRRNKHSDGEVEAANECEIP